MHDLVLLVDSNCLYAFLADIENGGTLPVYDINDRSSKRYTYSVFLQEKMVALSKYGSDLAQSTGKNYQPIHHFKDDGNYYYWDNFLQEHLGKTTISPDRISPRTALSLLISKIFFDANYISGFEGFSELFLVLAAPDPKEEIKNFFVQAIAAIDYELRTHVISLTDLVDYAEDNQVGEPLAVNSDVVLVLGDRTILLRQQNEKISGTDTRPLGTNQLLQAFGHFITGKISSSVSEEIILQELQCRFLFADFLQKLDAVPESALIWLLPEINGTTVRVRLSREECIRFLKTTLSGFQFTTSENGSRSVFREYLVFSEFGSHTVIRIIDGIIKNYHSGKVVTRHAPSDYMRNFLVKNILNFKSFAGQGERKKFQERSGIESDYFMSIYNHEQDSIVNIKIFMAGSPAPAYFSAIVKGRFRNQDRIYFEIKSRDRAGEWATVSRVVISSENELDFGEVITVNLRITYTKEDTIKVEATEQYSGKRLEITYLNDVRGDDYDSVRQKSIFRSMKILNNYMDKKKEQSMGIF